MICRAERGNSFDCPAAGQIGFRPRFETSSSGGRNGLREGRDPLPRVPDDQRVDVMCAFVGIYRLQQPRWIVAVPVFLEYIVEEAMHGVTSAGLTRSASAVRSKYFEHRAQGEVRLDMDVLPEQG